MRDTRYEIGSAPLEILPRGVNREKGIFLTGSALILTVVLTTLLAIVGVMFVMAARVDKIATSAISENRELNFAVETVIAKISQELVSDLPRIPDQEYYDYPDPCNAWLASLEPYEYAPKDYRWQQISDVTDYLATIGSKNIAATIIPDHNEAPSGNLLGQRADADGDGVADSKWFQLDNITSSKGRPIYAAIRIVDNSAMLNVNTAYKFDPNVAFTDANLIDGSSQLQINLMALASQPGEPPPTQDHETDLLQARANPALGVDPLDLSKYEWNVIWRYNEPNGPYTPFDISDELELRYRFLVNHRDIDTRLEELGAIGGKWGFRKYAFMTPAEKGDLDEWFVSAYDDGRLLDPNYAYRHLATTFNLDRIIDPNGNIMIDINRETDFNDLYGALIKSIADIPIPALDRPEIEARFAQLAVNIIDFVDDDDDNGDGLLDANSVTTFVDPRDPNHIFYGFEAQPFITEIGLILDGQPPDKSKPPIPIDLSKSSSAVELYNPFDANIPLAGFELELVDRMDVSDTRIIVFDPCDIICANSCFVISNNPVAFGLNPLSPNVKEHSELALFISPDKSKPPVPSGFYDTYDLYLRRRIVDVNTRIYVDKQIIDPVEALGEPVIYLGRDVRGWHAIYQTLAQAPPSMGLPNIIDPNLFTGHNFSFFLPNPLFTHQRFVTVGDIPRVLTIGHGRQPYSTIGEQLMQTPITQEGDIRLDLQNPNHRNVLQYLTVFDPNTDGIDNDGDGLNDVNEWQVPGRININTAPWYVIAQLPWVSNELAQAIVAYRDKLNIPVNYTNRYDAIHSFIDPAFGPQDIREAPGFESTGELSFVIGIIGGIDNRYSIQQYATDDSDLGSGLAGHPGFPDLTTDGPGLGDGVRDDFEERDVIFSRISNLVTVRSDVFSAYILVRHGVDGPQKRAIAILDRSNVYTANGKVRIVALHNVPDPR